MTKFNVGDRVRCIDASAPAHKLVVGKVYTIRNHISESNRYVVEEVTVAHSYTTDRFELVEEEPVTMLPETKKRGEVYRFTTRNIELDEVELSRHNPVAVVSTEEDTKHSIVLIHRSLVIKAKVTATSLAVGILEDSRYHMDVNMCTKKEAKELVRRCKALYHASWDSPVVNVSILTVNMQG